MSIVRIAGEKFKLASRWARFGAFLLDIGFLVFCQGVLWLIGLLQSVMFTDHSEYMMFGEDPAVVTFFVLSILLWNYGYFFMDGRDNGGGFGKKLLSLKIIRLKDGEQANYKDAFVRRFAAIFQPIDWLFALGKGRQRMGDKLAKTVVVKLDSPNVEIVTEEETEENETDLEKVLEDVILEITNRFSEAKQKVDASIGIEKQFQNAHDGAIAQAEKCEERAVISLKAGREDLAKEDLAQRNEYRQIANRYKEQWEEQKRTVEHLTTLLDTLQQKTQQTQREREVVIAQHKNVDAQEHLQQTLTELQENKAFEMLKKMGQNVTEAAALAKAASEVDVEFQDVELNREFANYAEDEAINKDLAELKERLQ
ncbi:MAG: PspA/IM30 family protein [Candidatus Poribacteria bacterium]|nr:PspA/IM30 family protein [Candidatus Poribacteria bacterium]